MNFLRFAVVFRGFLGYLVMASSLDFGRLTLIFGGLFSFDFWRFFHYFGAFR